MHAVTVAAGVFAPGHVGELTQYLPFELVDDVLAQTKTVQRRLRLLPSRAGVYFVLALGMFPHLGYARVWGKLTAGLAGLGLPCPSEKALRDLRRRLGPAPLKALFEVVAGPLAQPHTPGVRFGGLRTVAFDGCNSVKIPDTPRNRSWIGRIRYRMSWAGYPTLRLMTVVETGLGTLLAGGVFLLAFASWEQKARAPMAPMRLFRNPAFAAGNLTTFLMSGATFAAAFLITQEFQFARGYSPISAGLRLLPFFATPVIISPLAGALSDRIGRRPIMLTGLALQAVGYTWVAAPRVARHQLGEIAVALLVAGIGISMALSTVPTAVLNAVAEHEMGKASGVNYMAQRLGAVFSIAIVSAVFAAHGHLGNPAAVTAGFRPALWSCVIFAVLAVLAATAITTRPSRAHVNTPAADALITG